VQLREVVMLERLNGARDVEVDERVELVREASREAVALGVEESC
jgi:hypothetical protein